MTAKRFPAGFVTRWGFLFLQNKKGRLKPSPNRNRHTKRPAAHHTDTARGRTSRPAKTAPDGKRASRRSHRGRRKKRPARADGGPHEEDTGRVSRHHHKPPDPGRDTSPNTAGNGKARGTSTRARWQRTPRRRRQHERHPQTRIKNGRKPAQAGLPPHFAPPPRRRADKAANVARLLARLQCACLGLVGALAGWYRSPVPLVPSFPLAGVPPKFFPIAQYFSVATALRGATAAHPAPF